MPQKWVFLINVIRILWFIWDLVLMLFISNKDVVSGKILVFWQYENILGFPGINWAPKWTKTFNFGYVPFLLKLLILKDYLDTVFVLWETTSGRNFSKLVSYLGEKGLLNIYNLTATNAKLMKVTTSMYLHMKLNLAEDLGVTHRA